MIYTLLIVYNYLMCIFNVFSFTYRINYYFVEKIDCSPNLSWNKKYTTQGIRFLYRDTTLTFDTYNIFIM